MKILAALLLTAASVPLHIGDDLGGAQLQGNGAFRYFGLKVYEARLWVGGKRFDPAAPFALELCYALPLDGKRIASASRSEMAKVGAGSQQQLADWLEQMNRLFPSVRDGDCLSGHARPNAATRFYLNGKLLGEVADPDFGPAFFAIWLSPQTSAPTLRAELLGLSRR